MKRPEIVTVLFEDYLNADFSKGYVGYFEQPQEPVKEMAQYIHFLEQERIKDRSLIKDLLAVVDYIINSATTFKKLYKKKVNQKDETSPFETPSEPPSTSNPGAQENKQQVGRAG